MIHYCTPFCCLAINTFYTITSTTFAIIVPCNEELETCDNSYVSPIEDEQVYEIADGVDEFSFYVLL